jgi:L-seryl-tRNA(Ser) seleniumtransferase
MQPDFSKIPSMDSLLREIEGQSHKIDQIYIKQLLENLIRDMKLDPGRFTVLNKSRQDITDFIVNNIRNSISQLLSPSFKHVINGTGVILHTGLGRAPLNSQIIEEIRNAAGYTNLEIRLTTGKRGQRLDHVESLLTTLTSAEKAVVVNNNAAAVLLALNSLTRRKSVIVSRGELVEIGGSFRLPEVMKASGAKMVEIGATNKTHLTDYEQAITDKTAAILIVHPSNYKIVGFTEKPKSEDILKLAHDHDIPVIFDLGSGAFIDLSSYGFEYEPVVRDVISQGFDIVTFSGDKLLGGSQAGYIIGKNRYIKKIKKNHLLRALRCDKINLAIIAATLQQYLNPESFTKMNTTFHLLSRTKQEMENILRQLLILVDQNHHGELEVVESEGRAGSGAYPVHPIPSISLQIKSTKYSAEQLARQLRLSDTPVFGYIESDVFHLNFLTLLEDDLPGLGNILNKVL